MPIENANKEWPEKESPYQSVARIVFPVQDAYNHAKSALFFIDMSPLVVLQNAQGLNLVVPGMFRTVYKSLSFFGYSLLRAMRVVTSRLGEETKCNYAASSALHPQLYS